MTAKKYCESNRPTALASFDCYCGVMWYGTEDEKAYVAVVKGDNITYHKVKIHLESSRPFIRILSHKAAPLPSTRIYLDEFLKVDFPR